MTLRTPLAKLLLAVTGALLLLFIVGPLLRLVLEAGPRSLGDAFGDAEVRRAIGLTLVTATTATLLGAVLGLPLAWALARRRFPGSGIVEAIVDLPVVVPHPVAGIALLLFLGRRSVVGGALAALGLEVVNHPGGIVAAMAFVSLPILVSGAREAFTTVDLRLERVARSLGDAPFTAFRRVTLPLAGRGILAATLLAWARAVSEFGAVVVLTYNPKVASVLIFDRFTTDGLAGTLPAALALLLVALLVFGAVRLLRPRSVA
ncbi:MAG TPA: ABC transporter permease [Gemmatimonadales bacterium]|nr:ABC transporter permease [Gemmatimonadales bacterium]